VTTKPPPEDDAAVGDAIDRLDAGEPPSSPEEAQLRAPYERLIARIRDLDEIAPLPGWEDRGVARWAAVRRQRRVRIAIGVTAAVGLATAILVPLCSRRATEPGLQVAVSAAPGPARRGQYAAGDVLHAQARIDQAHVELRVYQATRLVVRCPGSEACRRDALVVGLDWKLAEPGTYRVVMLSSAAEIPPPVDGTIDRDLLAARSAGASTATETVVVGQ
jgi:hypothetical protein